MERIHIRWLQSLERPITLHEPDLAAPGLVLCEGLS